MANGKRDFYCSIKCPKGTFTGKDGTCHDCDYDYDGFVSVSQVSLEGCNQRPDERNQYNDYCVLKCPDETPFLGSNGECYPCDTEEKVDVRSITDVCMKCPNERQLDGNYCVLK